MSQVTLDIVAYDELKARAERYERDYNEIRKEMDACNEGHRVILKTKTVAPRLTDEQIYYLIRRANQDNMFGMFKRDNFVDYIKQAIPVLNEGITLGESTVFVNFEDIELRYKEKMDKELAAEREQLEKARKQYEVTSDEIEAKYNKAFRDAQDRRKKIQADYQKIQEANRDQRAEILRKNDMLDDLQKKLNKSESDNKELREALEQVINEKNDLEDQIGNLKSRTLIQRILNRD